MGDRCAAMPDEGFNAAIGSARRAVLAALHPEDAEPILTALEAAETAFGERVSELAEQSAELLREEFREAQDWYREHEQAIRAAGVPPPPDFMVPF